MPIESIIDSLLPALPAPPWLGPPLPIAWGIRWQKKAEAEAEAEADYTIWSGPVHPVKYVTRATIKKVRR